MRHRYEYDIVKVLDKNNNVIIEGKRLDCFRELSYQLTGKVGRESGYSDLKSLCKACGYKVELVKTAEEAKKLTIKKEENSLTHNFMDELEEKKYDNDLDVLIKKLNEETAFFELKIDLEDSDKENVSDSEEIIEIIMPGSVGYDSNGNKKFLVENVFFSPKYNKVVYRGVYVENIDTEIELSKKIIPIDSILKIDGTSKIGIYNIETGEVKKINE